MKVPDGYKRCKCRDGDGRELGAKCPRLKRRNGTWNPSHGTWYGQADVPVPEGETRARLRAGGFAAQDDMQEWFKAAIRLLEIPAPGPEGYQARLEILALVQEARDTGALLPSYDDLRRRYARGTSFEPGETGAYLLGWLEAGKKIGRWSAATLNTNEAVIGRHFIPAFGKVKLDRLRASHIYEMYDQVDEENERIIAARTSADPEERARYAGRRPMGPVRKRRVLAVLRSALGDACSQEDRQLEVNVAEGIKFGRGNARGSQKSKPRLWTHEREKAWRAGFERRAEGLRGEARYREWLRTSERPGPVMVWRPDHAGRFLDVARRQQHRMYALWSLFLYCAMRRGEAVGLPWTETDLDAGAVMAGTKTIVQVGWKAVEQEGAKTGESEDWVRLPEREVVAPLREWRRQQSAERLAWGPAWSNTGYVFTMEDGNPYHPNTVSDHFERMAYAAGLPPVTLRDVRHCAPTFALRAGVDIKVISAMMRHSSEKTTADLYAIVLPELAKEVSAAVASVIPRVVW